MFDGDLVVRSLLLSPRFGENKDKISTVVHFHFTNWGDHKALEMDNSFQMLESVFDQIKSNAIVHCSGGIGRTGSFFALLWMRRIFERSINNGETLFASIFSLVRKLREQRYSMVSSVEQYKFLYNYLVDYLKRHFDNLN